MRGWPAVRTRPGVPGGTATFDACFFVLLGLPFTAAVFHAALSGLGGKLSTRLEVVITALEFSWLYSWAGLCIGVPIAIWAAARGRAGWAVALAGGGVVATLVLLGIELILVLGRLSGTAIMVVDHESVAGPVMRNAEGRAWLFAAAKSLVADLDVARSAVMGFVAGPAFGLAFWLGLRLRAPELFLPDAQQNPEHGRGNE